MAVQAVYYSDRDGLEAATKEPNKLFASKAEADRRDKILELAGELQVFLRREVEGIDDDTAERVGIALAENADTLKKAFKTPSVLNARAEQAAPSD